MAERFFAAQAWLDGGWARDVLLSVGPDGCWAGVQPGASADQAQGAQRLAGPVLPGLVNAHSHAFQRAIAGLTERAGPAGSSDDFWSWRDRMYSVARRITPEQLEHIAAWLYAELLAGGYTQVCEFHYLHQPADADGGDPLAMSMALVRAAQRVGMGLTLLPTLYMRSGFGAAGLREDQRRFASSPDTLVRLVGDVQAACRGLAGVNLIEDPLTERHRRLDELVGDLAVPRTYTEDPAEAQGALDVALEAGHEGVMVKALDSTYDAGRRGGSWRKVKPVKTLDLVVLAAEWGHGRRQGWLSNLHLGARDPDGGFVMVGKTFKGLTDELLTWQTAAFLEREERREGITVFIRPELVVEIALDGVQTSTRYPGGVALRFARVKGYRPDKDPTDADLIGTVQSSRYGSP